MRKLIGMAIIATTVGAPTFALSLEAYDGAGTTTAAATSRIHSKTISRHPARHSYAMSPYRGINTYGGYLGNDNTGGGSPGYNEMLLNW